MVRKNTIYFVTLILILLMGACAPAAPATPIAEENAAVTDLSGIKTYLLDKSVELTSSSKSLKEASDNYYALAEAAGFDYAAMWEANPAEVSAALNEAKSAWMAASPLYEQMEGIVAGTPSLAEYDVILDAGTSAEEDPWYSICRMAAKPVRRLHRAGCDGPNHERIFQLMEEFPLHIGRCFGTARLCGDLASGGHSKHSRKPADCLQ
jgi:hypothetical protein